MMIMDVFRSSDHSKNNSLYSEMVDWRKDDLDLECHPLISSHQQSLFDDTAGLQQSPSSPCRVTENQRITSPEGHSIQSGQR